MTDIRSLEKEIRANVYSYLFLNHQHSLNEVYDYALFPPGKLFRPQLIILLAKDLCPNLTNEQRKDLITLATVVECHHVYTLIHDDMPCMDDDAMRRGRPSVHVAYSEWQALLAGDGLLNFSYQLLGELESSEQCKKVLKLMGKLLGAHGLIHGQFLDLSAEKNQRSMNFHEVLEIHKLKTSRLMQFCFLVTLIILEKEELGTPLFKLGHYLGIVFQLMDDLDDSNLHEFNAFKVDSQKCHRYIDMYTKRTLNILSHYQLENLNKFVSHYIKKS